MPATENAKAPERLIQDAIAGDADALQQLLLEHFGALRAFLSHIAPAEIRTVVSYEDLLQDTCADAYKNVRHLRSSDPIVFRDWLLTIARRRAVDALRCERALKRGGGHVRADDGAGGRFDSYVALLADLAVYDRTPSRSASDREMVSVLDRAMRDLPDDYRRAIELRYFEQLSVAEIAGRMDRTVRSVHNLCTRGLQQLRTALGEDSRSVGSS